MQRKRRLIVAKAAVILSAVPALIYGLKEGPVPGKSGVPNEGLCIQCHVGTANSGPGSVSVEFAAGLTYTPGVRQQFEVTVADPDQRRWGFQLTARTSDPTVQAGSFTPHDDGFTQVICAGPDLKKKDCAAGDRQYIEHTEAGTRLGTTGSGKFEFDWTPPATDSGDITIYVAGNAANGDGTNKNDRIYTKTYVLKATSGVPLKPQISSAGVVNGASFQPGCAAGSWATIQGTNLANTQVSLGSTDIQDGKLPTKLGGVTVEINGKPAYLSYVSPTQINLLAPQDESVGPVSVAVSNNDVKSDAATGHLQSFAPAFFLWDGKYAVTTRPDFSLVAKAGLFPGLTTVPAKPGDVVILWGTGFGPTNPAIPAGQLVPADQAPAVATAPTVTIGGVTAELVGAALSPGFAGLYQVAVKVPDSTPDGDIAVVVEAGGIRSPDNVFVTVQK